MDYGLQVIARWPLSLGYDARLQPTSRFKLPKNVGSTSTQDRAPVACLTLALEKLRHVHSAELMSGSANGE